ncbi:hypothetical protein K437DRAFT_84775 [Tilletiaria anomala UBC 951]|uniref:Uncharacterized protein n=1 Tax=Tilletiaria anomala (strain ATCC 24038 / CBS 436.72 / UBC 951) TaxID=1037660 RepID=A0A066W3J5_TILAU|nr:uncharacterized protein K437DRAFT_84775 [Tilletiaria anomala UBC 951]KDN48542.1 hypothetical protein K437DRAFT_84775 [Tilletiaria anomala UBC 951]
MVVSLFVHGHGAHPLRRISSLSYKNCHWKTLTMIKLVFGATIPTSMAHSSLKFLSVTRLPRLWGSVVKNSIPISSASTITTSSTTHFARSVRHFHSPPQRMSRAMPRARRHSHMINNKRQTIDFFNFTYAPTPVFISNEGYDFFWSILAKAGWLSCQNLKQMSLRMSTAKHFNPPEFGSSCNRFVADSVTVTD